MPAAIVTVAFVILIILLISIRQVNEYQRGVKFSLGKYSGTVLPGWRIIVPVFQSLVRVDMRIKAVDVPNQETITKDNISVGINAVIYYKIADSAKAILQVENFFYATSQLAQTTMRNVVGSVTLDHLLQNREELSVTIQTIIDKETEAWGIDVQGVELKDIMIPDDMKRTMAKAAEAERERRAVIIQAEGEVAAAENISKAAKMLASAPGALHLRTLQSINDISSDASNTTIWMIPVETLKALEGFAVKK
ncbi:MAG: slipin family protein [Candidatus Gracilibacteria bacterium]